MKRNFAPKAQNSRIQYKVLQNSRNFNKSSTEQALDYFRRFTNASKHRDQCLLALSYFNIDFQEILKISVFFWNQEDWTVSRFPVFGPFLAIFFQKVLHRIVLREKTGCKLPNCMWGKFCAEGAKFFDRHTEKCRPRRRPRGQAGATLALRVLSSYPTLYDISIPEIPNMISDQFFQASVMDGAASRRGISIT